ncbi:hypothetical protein D9611_009997 [Ephemerocybe angulata]|uniref:Uncharacterized protein n=2 Tax=Ephemerocybe angulata TaxID=980116 RepID=A0A8H6M227_9AGAR|nr:hypothetical protein D9611_009997 [Tulosesus angulatus]KAF6750409.1 hypothetical protein DFP72DRAFT_911090 [Tulosesus angulatus]
MANSTQKREDGLYLREAKLPEDFEGIVDVGAKAFALDPVFMFWGNVMEITDTGLKPENDQNLRVFMTFLLKTCIDMKARFTVICDPAANDKVVSAAYWVPPNERIALYQVGRLLRCGAIGFIKAWGIRGIDRITTQYLDKCHHSFQAEFKKRGLKRSVDDTWYLNLAMTDPAYQGKGLMSLLVREMFALNPEGIYTIEATTPKVKDQYAHLGFELISTFTLGKGVAGEDGLPKQGEEATGMPVSPMIRWPASWASKDQTA